MFEIPKRAFIPVTVGVVAALACTFQETAIEPVGEPAGDGGGGGVIVATFTPNGEATLSPVEIIATRNVADPDVLFEDDVQGNNQPAVDSAPPPACDCGGPTLTCQDFDSAADARECLELCGPGVHDIDEDGDGSACEDAFAAPEEPTLTPTTDMTATQDGNTNPDGTPTDEG